MLAALVVVGLPQFARAEFIDLVSHSYHIQQRGQGCCPVQLLDFDLTSAVPISHSATVAVDGGRAIFSASTNGGVTSDRAFVTIDHTAFDLGNALVNAAQTSAAITFRPLVSDLVVNIPLSVGPPPLIFSPAGARFSLFDDTAGLAVLTFPPYIAASFVSLNLEHLYTISASTSAGSAAMNLGGTLSIAPVPESGSTLAFLVVGLGALLIIARSQACRPLN